MNETKFVNWSEAEQDFANFLIEFFLKKYKEYERQHQESETSPVLLENISIHLNDCVNRPDVMQGIQLSRHPKSTAEDMLSRFWEKSELVTYRRHIYRLSKEGFLYKEIQEYIKQNTGL